MRYVFIVNPAAGKKDPGEALLPKILAHFERHGLHPACLVTERPRHAAELAAAEGKKGGEVRIYGFGGDGTLSEVAEGAVGMKNVEIGIFPCGSGNDFIKTFGKEEDFLLPEKQIRGVSRTVDAIRSERGISLNLCSVGMDAKIAFIMEKIKTLPFITGPMAYNLATAKVLLGRIGDDLQVTVDGQETFRGRYLFALAGNGRYYGGGFCAAPLAEPDDGLLDFVLIKKPAFHRIPKLVGLYKAGRHIDSPEFKDLLEFRRGKRMEIKPGHPLPANFDGEVRLTGGTFFELVPQAVRFIIPE